MNKHVLIGNLTKDPKYFDPEDKTEHCFFTIAVRGQSDEDTIFADVTVFGKTAQRCQIHLKKGARVAVSGSSRADLWTDKDGNPHASLKVMANEVEFQRKPPEKE